MSREQFVRITTEDTKKTYELPGKHVPKLWGAGLNLYALNKNGSHAEIYSACDAEIYLERQTLVDHGLIPQSPEDKPALDPAPTAEDLILQLLHTVGVYPEGVDS